VADLQAQLQSGLAGQYTLERELGRGGMATVFLAQDLKHKRPVALKVLHPELAHSLGPERFRREIEIAARLQHPHILTVHDSGETAGQLWFTMPFVEGESLRDRLRRQTQLPVEDAVEIAKEAAQALEYAHQHGVIHRDIKPENILLTTDGSTLVADFGIARALGAAGDGLTETGMSIGTPAYMSPEQASAERDLGATTDIYSLGCVLYEMLAGEPPFTGPTPQAILAKRLGGATPRVRLVRPAVQASVEQAVTRALAPVAADRFASAADFVRALAAPAVSSASGTTVTARAAALQPARRVRALGVAAALGLIVAVGAGLLWQRNHRSGDPGAAGPQRVAVLPFENLGKSEDEYFADGMSDAVRGKLISLRGLQVTARSSSIPYKKTGKTPQQIGQELGVQYLLAGTVRWERRSGGSSRVHVSPELIQVSTATAKWQQPFDAVLDNVFQVQTDIAGRVAQALDLAIGAGERTTLAERPTTNLAAYDAFLKGEEITGRLVWADPVPARQALRSYEQAVALASTIALAWSRIARGHAAIYTAAPTAAGAEQARAAAERAVALAPNGPEGRLALGAYYGNVLKDHPRALAQYELGLRSAPNSAELLTGMAVIEQRLGRWEASLEHLRQAATLDPRSARTAERLAVTLLWLRRYSEVAEASDRALALAPANLTALQQKVMVFLAQGDLPQARAVLRDALKAAEPTAVVAYMALYLDLYWVLEDQQQRLVLRLTPGAFDDNRAAWGLTLAATHALRGDQAKAHAYADSARITLEAQLNDSPNDDQLHVWLGLALAYLGRAEGIREGKRGVALMPVSKNASDGAYNQHQLARIYILVGEPEKALDHLEPLLKIPYFLSPGWLRIDPAFAPLKGNPRFERLAAGKP
jgi:TolB-like protein/tetratricopeptide (TPR) repeat protein/tRNA A-37 threonylcarbamoyl transferase component Bud32